MAKKPDVQPEGDSLLPDAQPETLYVIMTRNADQYGEPHSAQVHPNEVANYYSGGWVEAK
ncbi:TPA: hypothetical protein ACPY5B_004486 [Yersinia enterocolitica]|uniref:hypothetical protein n=1 Tax=Yersinia enterocolitica TaxID=630 RepID=UPI002AC395A5|nr:hypothetical protein [Yersinia enterocolitica]